MDYGGLLLEAAAAAGTGLVLAHLAPPRILHANTAVIEMLGMSAAELYASEEPFAFIVPEERTLVQERLRRRLAGEELPPAELTITRPDGTRLKVECRIVNLVIDGRPGAAVFMTRSTRTVDIAADAKYRDIVDAAPDGVVIVRGTRFLYANRASLALVDCQSFEDLSRRSLADFLSPDDLDAMAHSAGSRDYVMRGRDVEMSSVTIDFEGGPAILAFMRDVTDSRRMRADVERTHRLTALGTLVAGVAHEVNNPLAFARIGTDVLARFFHAGARDIETGRTALASIVAGLDRVASLVRELRTFARSEQPMLIPIELDDVLASALRMTAPTIRPRATLDAQLGALPAVRGSPGRLEQVFVNLLINAVQSFERDDVSKNIVRIRSTQTDGEVTFTIEDNGRGISQDILPRVFDPFFTTKPEGTGLGLSICHAIVTQHQGRIHISNAGDRQAQQGTTVTITLPIEDALEISDAPSSHAQPSYRRRMLVVDDEPTFARLLREMLEPRHDVTVVCGGVAAREALERERFDVVLCDITMPDLSGPELYESVSASVPELATRFVFMSGGLFTDEIIARVGSNAPRLEKPFNLDDVEAAIRRIHVPSPGTSAVLPRATLLGEPVLHADTKHVR